MDVLGRIWTYVCRGFQLTGKRITVAAIVPLFFIIPGAFAGGYSWETKQICLLIGITISTVALLRVAWNGALVGVGVGTVIASSRGVTPGRAALGAGLGLYVQFISAILTSEIAIGLIALVFPAHLSPLLSLFLIPICIGLFAWSLWQGGAVFWQKTVLRVLSLAAVLIVGWVVALAIMPNMLKNQFGKTSLAPDVRIVDSSLLHECLRRIHNEVADIHDNARSSGGYTDSDATIINALAQKELECTRKYQEPDHAQRLFAWAKSFKPEPEDELSVAIDRATSPPWTLPQFNLPPAELMKRIAVIGVILFLLIFLVRKRKSLFSDVGNWMIIILAFFGVGALVMWAVPSFWASFAASSTYTMLFGSYHPWG